MINTQFLGILDDEDDPETLINVNMIDAEKALRNIENRKKKPDYNPYDDAEEDEYGLVGHIKYTEYIFPFISSGQVKILIICSS